MTTGVVGETATAEPQSSVFVNCPFDEEYEPLMNAIVFAVVCCGFTPRVANESGDVAVPRLDRICSSLHDSRYSIHDLSRCTGEGDGNLARFNMPLELGMAMGRRFAAQADDGPDHEVLEALPRFEAAKEQLDIKWGKKAPWDLVVAEARYSI